MVPAVRERTGRALLPADRLSFGLFPVYTFPAFSFRSFAQRALCARPILFRAAAESFRRALGFLARAGPG